MKKLNRIFSKRVRSRRLYLGLTQEALAKKCKVNRITICNMETGRYFTTMQKIVRLADILDTSIDYLLGRHENPER